MAEWVTASAVSVFTGSFTSHNCFPMLWLAILGAFLPLIGYVALLRLPYTRRQLRPGGVLALMFLLGLLTPVGPCILAIKAIKQARPPGQMNCATGAGIFVVGGYFLTLVMLPALALVPPATG